LLPQNADNPAEKLRHGERQPNYPTGGGEVKVQAGKISG
jgi:hypothetical protein